MDFIDQRLQSVRKLFRIHIPIAQSGMIVLALAEPAIVHHKSIHADRSRFFRQRHLARFVHIKFRCLPRVVNHGTRFRVRRLRQNVRDLEVVQQPRRAAQTVIRVASIKNWCLQLLARFQFVAKIKWVEAAGHAHRIELVPLDRYPPRTGPRQRAKPDFPVLLIGDDCSGAGLARVARNRKPRICLMAGRSSAAFDHPGPADDWLLIERPLAGPTACQITQRVPRGR